MDQTILQQLRQLEQTKEIKIIYACESGSRSYGLDLVGEVSIEANDKELLYVLLEKKRAQTNLNNLQYDHLLSFLNREGSKWEEHIRELPDKKMDVQSLNELLWNQLGV